MASTDLDLCYLAATEAIDQFKAKKLSPLELMKALLARCEAVNPKLSVLTYTFAERARAQRVCSFVRTQIVNRAATRGNTSSVAS